MSVEVWGMICAGVAALVAALAFARPRFRAAYGPGKILVLGPICEAVALAIFAFEHFLAPRDLMGIVPRWLPGPLFWTYLVGTEIVFGGTVPAAAKWPNVVAVCKANPLTHTAYPANYP